MPASITRLTPFGRSAIGSFLLEGPGSFEVFAAAFRFPSGKKIDLDGLMDLKNRPVFGHLHFSSAVHEEVLVHFFDMDKIEFHTHGGDSVAAAVLDFFRAKNIDLKKIFSSDGSVESEKTTLLPYCKTEKTAMLLLGQSESQFENERNICPKKLSARLEAGVHLTVPFSVLIVGPPNAGKSSLLNRLLGFERVIVDKTAGTTRDTIAAETVLDGWPVLFYDTAGIRNTDGEIERRGIELIEKRLESVDLILFLFDAASSDPDPVRSCLNILTGIFQKDLAPILASKKILKIINKIDLLSKEDQEIVSRKNGLKTEHVRCPNSELILTEKRNNQSGSGLLNKEFDFGVSAATGEYSEDLEKEIVRTLIGPDVYYEIESSLSAGKTIALPFTEKQRSELGKILDSHSI